MRWATIIWMFYLMALTLMPCSDYTNRCEDHITSGQTTTTTQTHDHNQDSDDSCTPFCHCACCSISIAITDINIVPQIEKRPAYIADKKAVLLDTSAISAYSGNIWQPPRMNA